MSKAVPLSRSLDRDNLPGLVVDDAPFVSLSTIFAQIAAELIAIDGCPAAGARRSLRRVQGAA